MQNRDCHVMLFMVHNFPLLEPALAKISGSFLRKPFTYQDQVPELQIVRMVDRNMESGISPVLYRK